jgi:hypothetical protein
MTDADYETLAAVIVAVVKKAIAPFEARIAALEVRKVSATLDAAIEAYSSSFKGTWTAGAMYKSGEFVRHDGRIWKATSLTRSRPGSDGSFTLTERAR